ncbi:MAG: phenylalanine--tRNA ligase subunit alpha [Treponema sp.]|nr:phenylalanine--tRNA ligase subunit alpha [Treponema sp.]
MATDAQSKADDLRALAKNLHPLEVRALLAYGPGDELTIERVEKDLGFKPGNGNQALSWLVGKNLARELRRETRVLFELTDLGRLWLEGGHPRARVFELALKRPGELGLAELGAELGLDQKDLGSAFGALSKSGALALDENKRIVPAAGSGATDAAGVAILGALLERAAKSDPAQLELDNLSDSERQEIARNSKKRGAADAAFREIERETAIFGLLPAAFEVARSLREQGIAGDEIGALTPRMLETGAWKGRAFRSYGVNVPPARLIPGRSNAYAKFLEDIKDKLASLGFEEFDGPLVETEFWNCDALFMPQFHSAREIHDSYSVADPASADGLARAKSIAEPWLSNVASAHECGGATGSRGWSYAFDRDFTRRLMLRSQGTVISAKTLPVAKIPGKYFGMARCFRYDHVDATHLPDFFQTEGIVLGESVNLRTLLGMLEMFAVEVAGAKEVRYVPGYFPFTEPSVEIHIKHPVLGWFELGGSGIFRPEVTESLGVKVPVAAWGLGIDRMAMMALGINDMRELFTFDIESARLLRSKPTKSEGGKNA